MQRVIPCASPCDGLSGRLGRRSRRFGRGRRSGRRGDDHRNAPEEVRDRATRKLRLARILGHRTQRRGTHRLRQEPPLASGNRWPSRIQNARVRHINLPVVWRPQRQNKRPADRHVHGSPAVVRPCDRGRRVQDSRGGQRSIRAPLAQPAKSTMPLPTPKTPCRTPPPLQSGPRLRPGASRQRPLAQRGVPLG